MAAKLKDGLFIGDADTSKDYEFLELNKIGNLVNLAGKQLENAWASTGLVYLTLDWEDNTTCELFPVGRELEMIGDFAEFIDLSLRHGISVLLFSSRGVGRCVAAAVVYLMHKYHWGFDKAVQYMVAKKPDAELNQGFINQLNAIDRLLQSDLHRKDSVSNQSDLQKRFENMRRNEWDPSYLSQSTSKANCNKLSDFDNDELSLVHAYLNGVVTINALPGPYANQPKKNFTISFGAVEDDEDNRVPAAPFTGRLSIGALRGSREKQRKEAEIIRDQSLKPDVTSNPGGQVIGNGHVAVAGGEGRESRARVRRASEETRVKEADINVALTLEDLASRPERRSRRGMEAVLGSSVKAQHDIRPDLNLSALERELLPLESTVYDYETYRRAIAPPLAGGAPAWGESVRSGGSRTNSVRGSVSSADESRVPKVYRRGSPAPRGSMRPASSSAAFPSSASPSSGFPSSKIRPVTPDLSSVVEKRKALALLLGASSRERPAMQRSLGSSVDSADSRGGSRSSSPSRRGSASSGGKPSAPLKAWRF